MSIFWRFQSTRQSPKLQTVDMKQYLFQDCWYIVCKNEGMGRFGLTLFLFLVSLLLSPQVYSGGGGEYCSGLLCPPPAGEAEVDEGESYGDVGIFRGESPYSNTHNLGDEPFLQALIDPRINRGAAMVAGAGWALDQTLGRFSRWAYGFYRDGILPGGPSGNSEMVLDQFGAAGAEFGISTAAFGAIGRIASGFKIATAPALTSSAQTLRQKILNMQTNRISFQLRPAEINVESMMERAIARKDVLVKRIGAHYNIVEMNGAKLVEFNPARVQILDVKLAAHLDARGVVVLPNGKQVVVNGAGNIRAFATGRPLSPSAGGIPNMPGWMRMPLIEGETARFIQELTNGGTAYVIPSAPMF